jgi:flagellar hook protein FlgE
MASTSALFAGLSGMNANARRLDVIGNNIANANTTAFKSSRMLFSSQFSRTLSAGTAPGAIAGGTNPNQIGLGTQIAGTQRDFTGGSINGTGDPRDLAIEGNGFFIVDHAGSQRYTRAGAFRQNALNDLVNIQGDRVLGFGVDSNFNIQTGPLVPLNIPLGTLKLAEATQNVQFAGNLNAAGSVATQGTRIVLGGTPSAGFSLIPTATNPAGTGNQLETSSLLVEIADPSASTLPLFAAGQSIQIQNAEKGGRMLPTEQFAITATTTVQDLMDFLRGALGLNNSTGPNPNGPTPGPFLNPVNGRITITGNTGTVNDLDLGSSDIRLLDAAGTLVRNPFDATEAASATGESVRTTFVAYDSLGSPVVADLTMVLEEKSNGGTTWRYYIDSNDDTDLSPNVATGLVEFDTEGQLVGPTSVSVQIDRDNTGAASPMGFTVNFARGTDNITALASQQSQIAATSQDGSPLGVLSAFGVGADGVVVGAFTNGLTRMLGQVALASFTNQDGLVDEGANLFRAGPNSGDAVVTTPGDFGTGQIVGGALELSNVDLGREFIDMILTSTGYSASSRIIRTADELIQQLLVLGR